MHASGPFVASLFSYVLLTTTGMIRMMVPQTRPPNIRTQTHTHVHTYIHTTAPPPHLTTHAHTTLHAHLLSPVCLLSTPTGTAHPNHSLLIVWQQSCSPHTHTHRHTHTYTHTHAHTLFVNKETNMKTDGKSEYYHYYYFYIVCFYIVCFLYCLFYIVCFILFVFILFVFILFVFYIVCFYIVCFYIVCCLHCSVRINYLLCHRLLFAYFNLLF